MIFSLIQLFDSGRMEGSYREESYAYVDEYWQICCIIYDLWWHWNSRHVSRACKIWTDCWISCGYHPIDYNQYWKVYFLPFGWSKCVLCSWICSHWRSKGPIKSQNVIEVWCLQPAGTLSMAVCQTSGSDAVEIDIAGSKTVIDWKVGVMRRRKL